MPSAVLILLIATVAFSPSCSAKAPTRKRPNDPWFYRRQPRVGTFHWLPTFRGTCPSHPNHYLFQCTTEARWFDWKLPLMPKVDGFTPREFKPWRDVNLKVPVMSYFDPPDLNGEYERMRRVEKARRRGERVKNRDMRSIPPPPGAPYEALTEYFSSAHYTKEGPPPVGVVDVQRDGYKPEEGETTDPPEWVPSQIGPYKLVKNLGWGSFARVELAADTRKNNSVVALKFTGNTYKGVEEWFRREVDTMQTSALENPFVVPVLDVYETPKYLIMAMEPMDLGSLLDRVKSHDVLAEEDVQPIFQRLVIAVALMHRQCVAHKDIKPHNILFSSKWGIYHPLLVDFGLSVYTDERDTDYYRWLPWGTSWYMAPEQWFPLFYGSIDLSKTDVTSIGATLYHCLTDHPPDRGQGEESLLEWWYVAGFSPEAADFIQRSMWPYPEERMSIEDMYWHPWINPEVTLEQYVQYRGYPRVPKNRWNPGWIIEF